jgi:hypothetical protein
LEFSVLVSLHWERISDSTSFSASETTGIKWVLTFYGYYYKYYNPVKMEGAGSSETSVDITKLLDHTPEERKLDTHRREKFKFRGLHHCIRHSYIQRGMSQNVS